jgi:cytochrome c peroxidase
MFKSFITILLALLVLVGAKFVIGMGESKTHPYILEYDDENLGTPFLPSHNELTVEGVQLGRLLFYDPLLSSNNEMSCGTCHVQRKAFTDGRKLSIGTYGDTLTKNAMSLVNLAWSNEFFWDGRVTSLEKLVRDPITNPLEMGQDTIALVEELKTHLYYPKLFEEAFPGEVVSMENVSKAIAQFLRTLVSNGLKVDYNSFSTDNYEDEYKTEAEIAKEKSLRGSFVRFSDMCSPCHSGGIYGNMFMADNAVSDSTKAPSLLNIMHTAPYMHDGRFDRLEQVLQHYQTHLDSLPSLNADMELNTVNMLTQYDVDHADDIFSLFEDTSILTNPAFSNPFTENFTWADE